MDEQIFHRLDQLEHDARLVPNSDHFYDEAEADYHQHDFHGRGGVMRQVHRGSSNNYYDDDYDDAAESQPMVLDTFDEQLLRRHDLNSRQNRAAYGTARLSLPSASHHREFVYGQQSDDSVEHVYIPQGIPPSSSRLGLSRLMHDATGLPDEWSSSPYDTRLLSSPSLSASRRRAVQLEQTETTQGAIPHSNHTLSRYHPAMVMDKEGLPKGVFSREPLSVNQIPVQQVVPDPTVTTHNNNAPPIVQGIQLISTHLLPDRFRSLFSFPLFNAVQSRCFDAAYKSDQNLVLSSPTGSGKTAVMELAICRLLNVHRNDSFKIIYQAPTKALCAERQRDWQAKFGPLGLQCAELTGDSSQAQLRHVQQASVIITTPEKWDSMTRKWKDHQRLMQMVKLFLIDEVHIVKEDRGATLEAVVSRMKSVGSAVRFIALSATVPNSGDIAAWLGRDATASHIPANHERFGEEFRPVRLVKHVVGYQTNKTNDFAFEKILNGRLSEVIAKWSQGKPIMVFCFTRNSCVETAKLLAHWWTSQGSSNRHWEAPRNRIAVSERDLRDTILAGVAYHHAGLSLQDRQAVEKGYLQGEVSVICCTSTLAVGVNLPCHMVIIKNTVAYQSNAATCKEYSDLEIMQMLGRAGRPQFDDNGVAVIMTRTQKVPRYEKMISGEEILESCLHRNLIDHLNAEIGLGTVTSVASAKKWLSGTFLYVRLKANPEHYKINEDTSGSTLDDRLENICARGVTQLEENDLVVTSANKLSCTEYGDAMARYYVQFRTMQIFLALPKKAKVSEILSAIAQAGEYRDTRFRAGEKSAYKDLNKDSSIKFPIAVNLDLPAHKVSLVIQATLGCAELAMTDPRHTAEFNMTKALIFQHAPRLVRCIVDCQLHREDAIAARNALMLARSFGAHVWDSSPLHMKQLDSVGVVAVRKFVTVGITSIEELAEAESDRIERVMSRNPPYGQQIRDRAQTFPRLRINVRSAGDPVIKKGDPVNLRLKVELGFLNEKLPEAFNKTPVQICVLVETSDGRIIHFSRISGKKLQSGMEIPCTAVLINAGQTIRASIMCDQIAGTLKQAVLRPDVPQSAFPPAQSDEELADMRHKLPHTANTSRRRTSSEKNSSCGYRDIDEFGDDEIEDADLVAAEGRKIQHVDQFDLTQDMPSQPSRKRQKTDVTISQPIQDQARFEQLPNGKWACNHPCKDKSSCKHLCCREGLDKKPKPPKVKQSHQVQESHLGSRQTQLGMSTPKRSSSWSQVTQSSKNTMPLRQKPNGGPKTDVSLDIEKLHNRSVPKTTEITTLSKTQFASADASPRGREVIPRADLKRTITRESSDFSTEHWSYNYATDDDLPNMGELCDLGKAQNHQSENDSEDELLTDDLLSSAQKIAYNAPREHQVDHSIVDTSAKMRSFRSTRVGKGKPAPLPSGPTSRLRHGHVVSEPLIRDEIAGTANQEPKQNGPSSLTSTDDTKHDCDFEEVEGQGDTLECIHGSQGILSEAHIPRLNDRNEAADSPNETANIIGQDALAITEPSSVSGRFADTCAVHGELHQPEADEVKKWFDLHFGNELFNFIS